MPSSEPNQRVRLGAVATHPIQYWVPIYRQLAQTEWLDFKVYFTSDHSVRGGKDSEFGVAVAWDVPLLAGYEHEFVVNDGGGPGRGGFLSYRSAPLARALKDQPPDALLVPGYSPCLYLQTMRAAQGRGAAIVMRGENTDEALGRNAFKRWGRAMFLKWLYRRVTAFGAVGTPARRHFERMGVPPERVFWSPYCVDDALFERQHERWMPKRASTRQRLGIGESEPAFVFSGKLVPKKDPMTLAGAVVSLNSAARFHLLVLGAGELAGGFENALRPVLGRRLHLVGFVNQTGLGEYYAAADCLVLPSAWGETWGLVVNEAMQFGLPAIVSDRVGCREDLVQPGRTGWVFPAGNAAALASCLAEAAANPMNLRTMGRAARTLVARYSVAEAAKGLLAAVRHACPSHAITG